MGDQYISSRRKEISNFKLNALLDITLAINENFSTEELLSRYEDLLKEDLNIGKVLIFKYGYNWECLLNSGFDESLSKLPLEEHLRPFTEISFVSSSPDKISEEIDIIMPIFHHTDFPIAYILIGDIDEEGAGISPIIKHLHFIQTLSNIIIVAIENQRLYNENLQQAALKKELELASRMQNLLIPDHNKLPSNKYVIFKSFYHPHLEVGGDYYDIIELSEYEIGFCIADVSGKGISAAILMSNFQANLRAMFTKDISLEDLVRKLNERVLESANGEKFITMFIAKYNYLQKRLEYINAGHNPPFFFEMTDNVLFHLSSGCVGIGMLDEIPSIYSNYIDITGPSKLLCYTDGLVELIHGDTIDFGYKYLEEEISNHLSIEENIEEIIRFNRIKQGNIAIFDDISVLGIQFC